MKISITPSAGRSAVVGLSCGTSSPRLSGTVDISNFPNLTSFRCNGNNITSFTGYESATKLRILQLSGNLLSATPDFTNNTLLSVIDLRTNNLSGNFPAISACTNLQEFRIGSNGLSGVLPPLTANTNLVTFECHGLNSNVRQLSGSINIEGLNKLVNFVAGNSYISGPLPSLTSNTSLTQFQVYNAKLVGPLPPVLSCATLRGYQIYNNPDIKDYMFSSLNGISGIDLFWASSCGLSGSIPPLTSLSNMTRLLVQSNSLTGTVPVLSACTKLWSLQAHANRLTDFAFSVAPSSFATTQKSPTDLTPKGITLYSNFFNLLATRNCLSSMYTMYTQATAVTGINALTGVIISLSGANMPSINGVGAINDSIRSMVNVLTAAVPAGPGWTIALGASTING